MINLKLREIALYCEGTSAIDVGSDHGYLLVHLIQECGFVKTLGIDLNQGPLNQCQKNLAKYNFEKYSELRISDGLQAISLDKAKEYDSIIIAGMGGELIINIIKNDLEKFQKGIIVLQPNNKEEKVREFLNSNNFEILEEKIIVEKNVYYSIMKIIYSYKSLDKYNEYDLLFGKVIKINQQFLDKWKKEYMYLMGLEQELSLKNVKLSKEITNRMNIIKKMLKKEDNDFKKIDG